MMLTSDQTSLSHYCNKQVFTFIGIITFIVAEIYLAVLILNFDSFDHVRDGELERNDTAKMDENLNLPLCLKGLLDKNEFDFNHQGIKFGIDGRVMMMRPKKACRLHRYQQNDIALCLNSSLISLPSEPFRNKLSFAFVGDSRIRHQFYSFLKLMPDAETLQSQVRPVMKSWHEDVKVSIASGTVHVSYYWRPKFDLEFIRIIKRWVESIEYSTAHRIIPSFILIGNALHHMVDEDENYETYIEKLTKLKPILMRLSKAARVVWLNQFPTLEFFQPTVTNVVMNGRENLRRYNQAAQNVLRGSGVEIWDSGDPIAEEYIRSCSIHTRNLFHLKTPHQSYLACLDYAHLGYVATRESTQLLLNELCNRALSDY